MTILIGLIDSLMGLITQLKHALPVHSFYLNLDNFFTVQVCGNNILNNSFFKVSIPIHFKEERERERGPFKEQH